MKYPEETPIDERFAERLSALRTAKGVSAREMSLSIGQGESYINNIENKNNYPSMTSFFYICEYLKVTPQEFFDYENKDPQMLDELIKHLKKLDRAQLENITAVVKSMAKK